MACFPSFFIFLFCIILDWNRVICQQLCNITVDHNDAAISYTGPWQQSVYSELDEGGTHMIGLFPNASAVFVFQGVAVFFSSPLWPYHVTTQVQLDSRPPEILNLRDVNSPESTDGGSETVTSRIIWGAEGLDDQVHQLRISVAPGDQWAIVDGLIIRVVDQSMALAPSTTTASGTRKFQCDIAITAATNAVTTATTAVPIVTAPKSGGESSGKSNVGIGVGIGVGALALLVASVVSYRFCRRRRTFHTSRGKLQLDLEKDFPPTIRLPPMCATPSPTASSPGTSVAGDALPHSPIKTEPKDLSSSLPKYDSLHPPGSMPPTSYIASDGRRITFNRPPPAYHECINSSHSEPYRLSQLPPLPAPSETVAKS